MLTGIANAFLSLVYPVECPVCGREADDAHFAPACRGCWSSTTFFDGDKTLCNKCGAFFSGPDRANMRCVGCDDHRYDHASALGLYEKGLAAVIVALKTEPILPSALERAIGNAFENDGHVNYDLIIPVPLSAKRRLERGFNQAEIIAEAVGKKLKVSLDAYSLVRRLHTPMHRLGMDRRARELSVERAFRVVRPRLVNSRSVLLVDDVFTSGATASASAKALKKAGAARVDVFTLARAVLK